LTLKLDSLRALDEIYKALDDNILQAALSRASYNNQVKVTEILASRPEISSLAIEVREIKRRSIMKLEELIDQAISSLKAAKANPYYASSVEDARSIIGRIVGSNKLVILSKSMAAAELDLRSYLESQGNEVWETDLGEFLIQLEGVKPMHTIAPAVHMTREKALILLKGKLKIDVKEDTIESIANTAREFLRSKIIRADIGITGANALAADTGAIVTVENESNIRLVSSIPPVTIAIVPIDKIVPTLLDAVKVAIIQAAYAGLYPPTYINIVTGPSSTADIEQTRVYGAQGPKELHVILLDNGRLNAKSNPLLGEQLYCIRCGRCSFECPVWVHTANYWGGPVYGGPMGIIWTAITIDPIEAGKLAYLCLQCGRCDESCPVGIRLSYILRYLKTIAISGSMSKL